MTRKLLDERVQVGVVSTRFTTKGVFDRDGVGRDQVDQAALLENKLEQSQLLSRASRIMEGRSMYVRPNIKPCLQEVCVRWRYMWSEIRERRTACAKFHETCRSKPQFTLPEQYCDHAVW
jgi:hypothetical protein